MFKRLINLIIKSNWILTKPSKKTFLLIDGSFDPLKFYLKKTDYGILYRRGEEINLYILLKCFLKLDFKFKNYITEYIRAVEPELIITAIHNYVGFYKLSKLTGIKTLFIQSAITTEWRDIFGDKNIINKKNKKNFKVDYMLVFNSSYGKKFSSFISGKYYTIGSFKNNLIKKNLKKKKEVLFLSSFKSSEYTSNLIQNIPAYEFTNNEKKMFLHISKLSKINNLKINILGKQNSSHETLLEKKYYENFFGKNFRYIKNYSGRNTYKILRKYEYIINIDSTLGIENLSAEGRTGFLFSRPYKEIIKSRSFGYLENLGRKGPFWTTYNSEKEIERVFNFVLYTDKKKWKKIFKFYSNIVMPYERNNLTFKSILDDIIVSKEKIS